MAATVIARDPEAYGFSVANDGPFTYDEVTVDDSTDLRLIGRWLGCTREEIRELDPSLSRAPLRRARPSRSPAPQRGGRRGPPDPGLLQETRSGSPSGAGLREGFDARTTIMLAALPGQGRTAPVPLAGPYPPTGSYQGSHGPEGAGLHVLPRAVGNI